MIINKTPKILVAIPTYNCEKQITRVLKGFDESLLTRVKKVIVIDNGSSDNTVKAAKETIKKLGLDKVEVWRNKGNYNLGGSHKVAFLAAEKLKMEYVAILHGDDQAETRELHRLIDTAIENPSVGAVLGSRFMKESNLSGYSRKRIIGNRAINIIYSVVALRQSRDLGSGLNLFRLSDLSDHRYLGFGDTITFNIDLLLDYFKKKTILKYIPISWREEDQVSNARNFSVGITALDKLLKWRLGRENFIPKPASYYKSGKA